MNSSTTSMDRFPEGTPEVPYPHRRFQWPDGRYELSVELPLELREEPPMLRGWCPMRIAFEMNGTVIWTYARLDPLAFYDAPPAPKSIWD